MNVHVSQVSHRAVNCRNQPSSLKFLGWDHFEYNGDLNEAAGAAASPIFIFKLRSNLRDSTEDLRWSASQ
jgi:hypothetical protein